MILVSDLAAIIVCGGQSRRFGGGDKALARLGGRTLLDRVLDVAGARAAEIVLAVGSTPRYAGPEDATGPGRAPRGPERTVTTVLDPAPDQGPLAGIAAGLDAITRPFVLLAAVDLPLITPEAIDRLTAALGEHDYVVPTRDGRLEPLFSLGRREPLRRAVAALRAAGERAPRRLAERLDAVRLPVPDPAAAPLDPLARALLNVNTPEDLERAWRAAGADTP